jgi:thioredoxin 1
MKRNEELERIRLKKLRELMKRTHEEPKEQPEARGVVILNSSNFDDFIRNATVPVLVDFWAEWCTPCLMMGPVLEELARDYAGKSLFARLNVDVNSKIARQYGIMSIPLFMIFNGGRPVERVLGAVGRGPLERVLRKYVRIQNV